MAMLTLPDYLRPGLHLVFVGLNPGLYSAQTGKYFARPTNRFWPALSQANFFGREVKAGDEKILFEQGVGFTDVVKRATAQIDELTRDEIIADAQKLRRKIKNFSPAAVCLLGVTGFRWVFQIPAQRQVALGPQTEIIGASRVYVLPSPSPANAHSSLPALAAEFRQLKIWLRRIGINYRAQ